MTSKHLTIRGFAVAAATGAFLLFGQFAVAQTAGDGGAKQKKDMPKECQAMMANMEDRKAKMRQADKELQQKVDAMNRAQGPAKVEAMASLLTQMVNQRSKMREQMQSMSDDKMKHMMGHMGDGEAMKNCSMMSKSGDKDSGR
jgi:hypothetical protein